MSREDPSRFYPADIKLSGEWTKVAPRPPIRSTTLGTRRRGALALTRRTSAALVRAARHAAFFDRRRRERSERGERSEGAVRLRLPRIVTSDERKHARGASSLLSMPVGLALLGNGHGPCGAAR